MFDSNQIKAGLPMRASDVNAIARHVEGLSARPVPTVQFKRTQLQFTAPTAKSDGSALSIVRYDFARILNSGATNYTNAVGCIPWIQITDAADEDGHNWVMFDTEWDSGATGVCEIIPYQEPVMLRSGATDADGNAIAAGQRYDFVTGKVDNEGGEFTAISPTMEPDVFWFIRNPPCCGEKKNNLGCCGLYLDPNTWEITAIVDLGLVVNADIVGESRDSATEQPTTTVFTCGGNLALTVHSRVPAPPCDEPMNGYLIFQIQTTDDAGVIKNISVEIRWTKHGTPGNVTSISVTAENFGVEPKCEQTVSETISCCCSMSIIQGDVDGGWGFNGKASLDGTDIEVISVTPSDNTTDVETDIVECGDLKALIVTGYVDDPICEADTGHVDIVVSVDGVEKTITIDWFKENIGEGSPGLPRLRAEIDNGTVMPKCIASAEEFIPCMDCPGMCTLDCVEWSVEPESSSQIDDSYVNVNVRTSCMQIGNDTMCCVIADVCGNPVDFHVGPEFESNCTAGLSTSQTYDVYINDILTTNRTTDPTSLSSIAQIVCVDFSQGIRTGTNCEGVLSDSCGGPLGNPPGPVDLIYCFPINTPFNTKFKFIIGLNYTYGGICWPSGGNVSETAQLTIEGVVNPRNPTC